ncbi:MAG: hypothetical protein Q4G22_04090 [Paracoccus sp. (in: a-proteobacteria)]|uniref:hypothetical protein n=1 Tax=Paracoccus sp. TaxID=267 RepID=UPI0026E07461|nr:hypothetical protein [Paracoccus sp. (in: a-proteobacteria)]MDO5630998.1 hypothetical protein [Paracoccus sp. (in: a-proteobacteria)]
MKYDKARRAWIGGLVLAGFMVFAWPLGHRLICPPGRCYGMFSWFSPNAVVLFWLPFLVGLLAAAAGGIWIWRICWRLRAGC